MPTIILIVNVMIIVSPANLSPIRENPKSNDTDFVNYTVIARHQGYLEYNGKKYAINEQFLG